MIDLYKSIGKNIRDARKDAGLNQMELAEILQVERTTITNMETGKQTTSIDRLMKISELLDVPIVELLKTYIDTCPTCGHIID